MGSKRYTEADVRDALRRYVAMHGYEQAVRDFGYSYTQDSIDRMIAGTSPISSRITKRLRFEWHTEVYYTRKDEHE